MKVFLTGATGFIGSHVARLLVREGCEVHVLIRQSSSLWRISDIVSMLHIVPYDLLAAEELDTHLEVVRPDICLHLAWYAEPGKYLTSQENLPILFGSLHLASRLAALGCKRFVAAGTCFEFDTDLGYLSETSQFKPRSLYAASKLALHLILEQFANISGMSIAWLHLFYQYGPFEDERRLVPSIICSLLRNQKAKVTAGEQIKDFLHVQDVATAIWSVARSDFTGPVNIGSGKPVSVREIAHKVGEILDRVDLIELGAVPYSPSDPMFICANNRQLVERTNWVPRFDLHEGLLHTIEWWQSNWQPASYACAHRDGSKN